MQIAFFLQFSLREDVLYVATYDRHIALEQLAKLRLTGDLKTLPSPRGSAGSATGSRRGERATHIITLK